MNEFREFIFYNIRDFKNLQFFVPFVHWIVAVLYLYACKVYSYQVGSEDGIQCLDEQFSLLSYIYTRERIIK